MTGVGKPTGGPCLHVHIIDGNAHVNKYCYYKTSKLCLCNSKVVWPGDKIIEVCVYEISSWAQLEVIV